MDFVSQQVWPNHDVVASRQNRFFIANVVYEAFPNDLSGSCCRSSSRYQYASMYVHLSSIHKCHATSAEQGRVQYLQIYSSLKGGCARVTSCRTLEKCSDMSYSHCWITICTEQISAQEIVQALTGEASRFDSMMQMLLTKQ